MKDNEINNILSKLDTSSLEVVKSILNKEGVYRYDSDTTAQSRVESIVAEHISRTNELKEMLLEEQRYNEMASLKKLTEQRAFETYITTVLRPGLDKYNYYGMLNDLFTFANGCSFYQLKEALYISKYILDRQKKGARWEHRSKEASESFLLDFLNQLQALNSNPLPIEFESKAENKLTVLESKGTNHTFSAKELWYLDKFLGMDKEMSISEDNPLLYASSSKGSAYVLGFKKVGL